VYGVVVIIIKKSLNSPGGINFCFFFLFSSGGFGNNFFFIFAVVSTET
jgi:hypothetical protein